MARHKNLYSIDLTQKLTKAVKPEALSAGLWRALGEVARFTAREKGSNKTVNHCKNLGSPSATRRRTGYCQWADDHLDPPTGQTTARRASRLAWDARISALWSAGRGSGACGMPDSGLLLKPGTRDVCLFK